MSIKEILKKYSSIEIDLLLSHILGKPKEFLFMSQRISLSANQLTRLDTMAQRRLKGEPIAYILGYKDFCGLRFKVNKDVLIPRPETEWLVERIMKYEVGIRNKGLRILDMGTGSGCIAVTLGKQFSINNFQFSITGADISSKSLKMARENARHHHTKIKFIQSDLFKNIDGKFDIIIANLPYVPAKMLRRHLLHKPSPFPPTNPFAGLAYEPAFALTDGGSSWQIYRRFFQQVGPHLNPKSLIYLEIDPAQKKELPQIIKKYLPNAEVKFYKDFRNLWRYVVIQV